MPELKILIKPYNGNLIIDVDRNFSEKICRLVEKIRNQKKDISVEIPETGYRGMILTCGRDVYIYVNNKEIIYKKNNITAVMYDGKTKIQKILLRKAALKYRKELNYYFEVKEKAIDRETRKAY